MRSDPVRSRLAMEAKSIVAICFRNCPIEDVHAGQPCPTCAGVKGYSRIIDEDMQLIMQNAINQVYRLLGLKAKGYARSEFVEAQVTMLGETATLVRGVAVRYKLDESELERVAISYLMHRAVDGWKIATMVLPN